MDNVAAAASAMHAGPGGGDRPDLSRRSGVAFQDRRVSQQSALGSGRDQDSRQAQQAGGGNMDIKGLFRWIAATCSAPCRWGPVEPQRTGAHPRADSHPVSALSIALQARAASHKPQGRHTPQPSASPLDFLQFPRPHAPQPSAPPLEFLRSPTSQARRLPAPGTRPPVTHQERVQSSRHLAPHGVPSAHCNGPQAPTAGSTTASQPTLTRAAGPQVKIETRDRPWLSADANVACRELDKALREELAGPGRYQAHNRVLRVAIWEVAHIERNVLDLAELLERCRTGTLQENERKELSRLISWYENLPPSVKPVSISRLPFQKDLQSKYGDLKSLLQKRVTNALAYPQSAALEDARRTAEDARKTAEDARKTAEDARKSAAVALATS